MNKFTWFIMGLLLVAQPVVAEQDAALETLRGAAILTDLSPRPEIKKWLDTEPIPRNYARQPPLIPHTTKGYVINQKFNKCLTCHSYENAKISGATPVGQSHYTDRNNTYSEKIAGRRYFCEQCHVPQVAAEPFMSNDFKPEE